MPRLSLRPQADGDAFGQTRYLVEDSGAELAGRFVADLEAAFDQLARYPHLGRPWPTRNPRLQGVRRLLLSRFPLSIFYRPTPELIEVIRVLHHRRDLPRELEE